MRPCFICRSESSTCGHRETDVILAILVAKRWRLLALMGVLEAYNARKAPERAKGVKTPRNGKSG